MIDADDLPDLAPEPIEGLDALDDFDSDELVDAADAARTDRNEYITKIWARYGFDADASVGRWTSDEIILSAHRMLQSLVDTFATGDVPYVVSFDKRITTAGTDMQGKRVLVSSAPLHDQSLTLQQAIIILVGFGAHESSHVRYGRSTAAAVGRAFGPSGGAHALSNILDDVRIEYRFKAEFPGYADVFRPTLEYVARGMTRGGKLHLPRLADPVGLVAAAVRYSEWCDWSDPQLARQRDWWQAWGARWAPEDAPRRHVEAIREGLAHIKTLQLREKARREAEAAERAKVQAEADAEASRKRAVAKTWQALRNAKARGTISPEEFRLGALALDKVEKKKTKVIAKVAATLSDGLASLSRFATAVDPMAEGLSILRRVLAEEAAESSDGVEVEDDFDWNSLLGESDEYEPLDDDDDDSDEDEAAGGLTSSLGDDVKKKAGSAGGDDDAGDRASDDDDDNDADDDDADDDDADGDAPAPSRSRSDADNDVANDDWSDDADDDSDNDADDRDSDPDGDDPDDADADADGATPDANGATPDATADGSPRTETPADASTPDADASDPDGASTAADAEGDEDDEFEDPETDEAPASGESADELDSDQGQDEDDDEDEGEWQDLTFSDSELSEIGGAAPDALPTCMGDGVADAAVNNGARRPAETDRRAQKLVNDSQDLEDSGRYGGKVDVCQSAHRLTLTSRQPFGIDERSGAAVSTIRAALIAARGGTSGVQRHQSRGRLSGKDLHRIVMQDPRLFEKRTAPSPKRQLVWLLVDQSGSMSGQPTADATAVARALAEASAGTPTVRMAVWAWSTPFRKEKAGLARAGVVKVWATGQPSTDVLDLARLQQGGTPDSTVLAWAWRAIKRECRSGERPVILLASDGWGESDLGTVVADAAKAGVVVRSIAFGDIDARVQAERFGEKGFVPWMGSIAQTARPLGQMLARIAAGSEK